MYGFEISDSDVFMTFVEFVPLSNVEPLQVKPTVPPSHRHILGLIHFPDPQGLEQIAENKIKKKKLFRILK